MTKEKLNIVVIEGTTRKQRKSIHVARFVASIGKENPDLEITLVDPAELDLDGDGNDPEGQDPRYSEITANADGFFVVTPEYNHSFPGSLKRLLDSELKNYIHKPVAMAGVSSGRYGGVRAVEHLVPVLRELGMAVTFNDVYFAKVGDLFDDNGNMAEDSKQIYLEMVNKAYDELIWYAKTLKYGRENV